VTGGVESGEDLRRGLGDFHATSYRASNTALSWSLECLTLPSGWQRLPG
jgi:hypothetical protein